MGVERAASGPGEPPMNPGLATPLFALAGVVVVLFICRTIVLIRHHLRLRGTLQEGDESKFTTVSSLWANIKKHILYAPFCSVRHNREFRLLGRFHMGTIPLRLEVCFLLCYIALNIVFLFVLVDWSSDFHTKMFQLKYAAGHLAVMNSPALVLTAGRNNPLIPLLGIQFDTFNLVHRWIGRLMAVESVVHMGCVTASLVRRSKYIIHWTNCSG